MADANEQPADKLKRISHEIEVQERQIKAQQASIKVQQDLTLLSIDVMNPHRVQMQTCLKDFLAENKNLKSRLAEAEAEVKDKTSRLGEAENLKTRLADAEAELMDKRDAIRTLRTDLEKYKSEVTEPVPAAPKGYVAVMIDATYLRFTEKLVSQGYDGGKSAAALISENIMSVMSQTMTDTQALRLVVRIMGHNNRIMAQKYENHFDLYHFVRGFNTESPECSWLDMGDNFDRVSERLGVCSSGCKKLFLGGACGEVYTGVLEGMPRDKISKITLISGAALHASLTSDKHIFSSVTFADIFETQLQPAATSLKRKATNDLPQPPKPPQPSGTPNPHDSDVRRIHEDSHFEF
ncbi:hypothetical protein GE09DRAFT_1277746 [Coniochaeta sp. 2T2.1]|nr:hypothetical protein GE09DRAFT_1277746 [Coniochaeta sp. 2T2.1]